jgi:collagenase-like PrtC family protease
MAQFLSIPVTSEGNQLISARGVLLVDSATSTAVTTVLTYDGGKAITLTHAAAVAFDVRDAIQDALVLAHSAGSAPAVTITVTMPKAVSGIAVA